MKIFHADSFQDNDNLFMNDIEFNNERESEHRNGSRFKSLFSKTSRTQGNNKRSSSTGGKFMV